MRDDDTDDTLDVTCAYCFEDFNPANFSDRDAVRLTCEGVCPKCNARGSDCPPEEPR